MRIQSDSFLRAWETLEKRFGKQPPGSAADYLGYLDGVLTDEEFGSAWRAVWATCRFFPRPADFLMVRQGEDWAKVQEAEKLARKREDWGSVFRSMTPQGQKSIQAMGGIFVVGEQMQKSGSYVRRDFGAEYEMAVTTLAIENTLGTGQAARQLTAGGDE